MLRKTSAMHKMRSIPFINAEASQSIYRTTDWIQRNPVKSVGIVLAAGVASVIYEAKFSHNDRVPSHIVGNPLEYDTYSTSDESERLRLLEGSPSSSEASSSPSDASSRNEPLHKTLTMVAMEREIEQQKDPFLKRQMQASYEAEMRKANRAQSSAMVVTSSQLDAREPHWNLRMNEKNWSIMSRDMQKQKDSYVYRLDRSRDDDFGRNAAGETASERKQ